MLRPLQRNETDRAGRVLGEAFIADPLWMAAFPDPEQRPELLVAMFIAVTKATFAARGIAETTANVDAVALWLPPGKNIGFWAMVNSSFALPRFAMKLSAPDRNRMMTVLRQLDERKKALMPERHWYLEAVGVSPQRQGDGLGSALVLEGIDRADDGNTPIYLETETEGNVAFYQHLGFEVIEAVTAAGLDLPVWLMVRRPGRTATS